MNNDLRDILSNSNKDIDNQQLMDYLASRLNKPNEHEVEQAMADDVFMNDAVEGLQEISDKKNLAAYVDQLNDDLQKQIAKNKKRKEKRRLKESPYTVWVIILLLLLLVICFVTVKKYLDTKKNPPAPTSRVIINVLSERQGRTLY